MKHYGVYERFYASYIKAFRYIEEHGYMIPNSIDIDGARCTNHLEDPENGLSIIQIPKDKE